MSTELQPELRGKALGNQYAVHALRERRAEMAGELVQTTERLRYLKRAIENLDETLAIMSPGFDPASIKPKRVRRKAKLFGAGKLNQMILDVLRRADRPMSVVEITEGVGAAAGFGPEATAGLRTRVRSNLLYLVKVRGTVTKYGEGRGARWRLALCEPADTVALSTGY